MAYFCYNKYDFLSKHATYIHAVYAYVINLISQFSSIKSRTSKVNRILRKINIGFTNYDFI